MCFPCTTETTGYSLQQVYALRWLSVSSFEPTVFIVDDDPTFRKSLHFLIESVGVNAVTFESANQFFDDYDPQIPGCVVLDVRMPGMSGLELQEQLRERNLNIPVIVITAFGDVPMAVRAMKAGALDFFEKPFSDQTLLDQVQKAINDDVEQHRHHVEKQHFAQRAEQLTRRELEVMELVVEGMSSKEIANELDVSFKTVEAHRAKIMKKMEARSVPHLIRMNLAAGLEAVNS
ncbi:MAG: DNA-binding response regulator [Planctomycetaceae bacterium]|nr:DNA-binding response regulator [Planctomycetaceae bacterium]